MRGVDAGAKLRRVKPSRQLTWIFLIAGAFLIDSLISVGAFTLPPCIQGSQCDPQLKQSGDDPNGYRLRGDRCEGIYIKEVASTTLLVASLTESFEDFNATTGKPLLVEWTAPGHADVRIRAHALKHRLYYQMDTIRPSGSGSYTWPSDLLSTYGLRRNELGVIALTSYAVGSETRDVYVPLRIRQQAPGSRSSDYQLVLLPGVELAEVYISLAAVGRDGSIGTYIKKDEPLKQGYYPADRGIRTMLQTPSAPRIYRLEIKAMRRTGGPASAPPVWFYRHG